MKALAITTLALLGVSVSGLRHNRLIQSIARAELPADTNTHTCTQAIQRVASQANFDF